jgi:hypothetical protein
MRPGLCESARTWGDPTMLGRVNEGIRR